jgi:hypothetical protein
MELLRVTELERSYFKIINYHKFLADEYERQKLLFKALDCHFAGLVAVKFCSYCARIAAAWQTDCGVFGTDSGSYVMTFDYKGGKFK